MRGLSSGQGGRTRDMYVAVTLDEEEVYRTTIIEKTVKYVQDYNRLLCSV